MASRISWNDQVSSIKISSSVRRNYRRRYVRRPYVRRSKCGWQSAKFGFISNKYNLPGTPVRNKTLSQCVAICKKNKRCKAFSYMKGRARGNCWLKTTTMAKHAGKKLYKTQKWFTYIVKGCGASRRSFYRRYVRSSRRRSRNYRRARFLRWLRARRARARARRARWLRARRARARALKRARAKRA